MATSVLAVAQPAPPAAPIPTSLVPKGNIVRKDIRPWSGMQVADLFLDVPLLLPGVVESRPPGFEPLGQFQGGSIVIARVGNNPIPVLGNTNGSGAPSNRARATVAADAVVKINPMPAGPAVPFVQLADDSGITTLANGVFTTRWKLGDDLNVKIEQFDEKYKPVCVRARTDTIEGPTRAPLAFSLHILNDTFIRKSHRAQALDRKSRESIAKRKRAQAAALLKRTDEAALRTKISASLAAINQRG